MIVRAAPRDTRRYAELPPGDATRITGLSIGMVLFIVGVTYFLTHQKKGR